VPFQQPGHQHESIECISYKYSDPTSGMSKCYLFSCLMCHILQLWRMVFAVKLICLAIFSHMALIFVCDCIGFCHVWHAQHLKTSWVVWTLLPSLHPMRLMQWSDLSLVRSLSVCSWVFCLRPFSVENMRMLVSICKFFSMFVICCMMVNIVVMTETFL